MFALMLTNRCLSLVERYSGANEDCLVGKFCNFVMILPQIIIQCSYSYGKERTKLQRIMLYQLEWKLQHHPFKQKSIKNNSDNEWTNNLFYNLFCFVFSICSNVKACVKSSDSESRNRGVNFVEQSFRNFKVKA